MTKFQVGQSYATTAICDADLWVRVNVVARTAKTIIDGRGKRLRITLGPDGVECVRPWGSYSMCPIVGADDIGRGTNA